MPLSDSGVERLDKYHQYDILNKVADVVIRRYMGS